MLDELKPFVEKFYKDYDVSKYTAYISDLVKAWYVMAISIGVAVVTAIIYLLVLRCCAGVMIWMSIIGISGGMLTPYAIYYLNKLAALFTGFF